MAILSVFGIILVTIYGLHQDLLAVRRHKNQIQVLQVQQVAQTDEVANLSSFIKFAVGIFYVYFVTLVYHLLYLISFFATKISCPTVSLNFFLFSQTLLYLNSSLNPVIYCWKMKHVQHAVMNVLRNMTWYRNHASHETLTVYGHTVGSLLLASVFCIYQRLQII